MLKNLRSQIRIKIEIRIRIRTIGIPIPNLIKLVALD
jgi:hypothetical protein